MLAFMSEKMKRRIMLICFFCARRCNVAAGAHVSCGGGCFSRWQRDLMGEAALEVSYNKRRKMVNGAREYEAEKCSMCV